MTNISNEFASNVFHDKIIKERLPEDIYQLFKQKVQNNEPIDINMADIIACAMKEWAIEKGATHYAHWFHPLTDKTAQKNNSFITRNKKNQIVFEFSGKELMKGECDASSLPHGGLRSTFEARGYTLWDYSSNVFIKDYVLYIPTLFYSFNGEILDQKIPLLRSIQQINKQALRILRLFGNEDVASVSTHVGCEQEYFLIDQTLYNQRKDLILCGRTLFGALPPKTQELEDHYFRTINIKVRNYMNELNHELWKLGIHVKNEHKEVAPNQYELAPIYSVSNIALDHDHLTMECLKEIATKHHYTCLLHEKPFLNINGSGKHNNWSMMTNTGIPLLEPSDTPQFLLFLLAIIKGVDEYQDLFRFSAASYSNDYRLGSNEAPPAIISIDLGDALMELFDKIEQAPLYENVNCISQINDSFDMTDRNRTSPIAFSSNKFEFRMLGSASSIAFFNTIMNTVVAEELQQFTDILENGDDFMLTLHTLIRETIHNHKRILFSKNGYSSEWKEEAKKRGLLNLETTLDCLPYFTSEKNIHLFTKQKIFTKEELYSRKEILFDQYQKHKQIEALTMIDMVHKLYFPSLLHYQQDLSQLIINKREIFHLFDHSIEMEILKKIGDFTKKMMESTQKLEDDIKSLKAMKNDEIQKNMFSSISNHMTEIRMIVDTLEKITPETYWPIPTYYDLLFANEI